jgi:hypothetical protein
MSGEITPFTNRSQYLQPGETTQSKVLDLNNADHVMLVLEEGTSEQREELRNVKGISGEQLDVGIAFARLRRLTIQDMQAQVAERRENNPSLTPDETRLGIYGEELEPQVKDVVFVLLEKGYAPIYSGFDGPIRQAIAVKENALAGWSPSKETLRHMKDKGVRYIGDASAIQFTCDSFLDLEELREIWDMIKIDIPILKQP